MLSPINLADVAPARTRPASLSTLLAAAITPEAMPAGGTSVLCGHAGQLTGLAKASARPGTDVSFARPRSRKAAYLLGYDAQAAGQAECARQQRPSNVKFAHTIRIATKGGGS